MDFKYEEFNANPKKRKTGDCVIRAICKGLDESWEDTYRGMFEIALKTGYAVNSKENFTRYLKSKGYEMEKMPKKITGKRYTVKEFVEQLAKPNKTYIINLANHLTVVKNGTLYDIWNCGKKSVGNYWVV
jgi:hypothetical protein